jgi:hypothetical protein
MMIKASQLRMLPLLLGKWDDEQVIKIEQALKIAFPKAYAWEKIDPKYLILQPYSFTKFDIGVDISDVVVLPQPGNESGQVLYVGVWRPGRGVQEFSAGNYIYRVVETFKDGTFSVWRCQE